MPTEVIFSGKVMVTNLQPAKVEMPILAHSFGKVTLLIPALRNAKSPISVKVSGRRKVVNLASFSKAFRPILVILVSCKLTVDSAVHPAKA